MTAQISRTKAVTLALCVLLTIIGLLALRGGVAPVGTSKSLLIPSGYVDSWEDGVLYARASLKHGRSLHLVLFGLPTLNTLQEMRKKYATPVVPYGCVVGKGWQFWSGYNERIESAL
jgi:hypothetical protein